MAELGRTGRRAALAVDARSVAADAVSLVRRRSASTSAERASQALPPQRSRRSAASNGYGLFAVMTTTRPEIIIEGSDDGDDVGRVRVPLEAGRLDARRAFVAPHQPRLDWQMWFAALGDYRTNPGSSRSCSGCSRASSRCSAPRRQPFPERPPRFVRAALDQYRFTDLAERRVTGHWWKRERQGLYFPQVSLESFRRAP